MGPFRNFILQMPLKLFLVSSPQADTVDSMSAGLYLHSGVCVSHRQNVDFSQVEMLLTMSEPQHKT